MNKHILICGNLLHQESCLKTANTQLPSHTEEEQRADSKAVVCSFEPVYQDNTHTWLMVMQM